MGRISKRKSSGQKQGVCASGKWYKAGIYARLSSDQDIKKNESVEMQIEIAKKYVEEFNRKNTEESIEIIQCYTDLGKTGSNFEREGFLRLLQDIRLGDINCIIVKDLSRFGRNYLEAGNYIEKIFPFLGVRFIAVADGFDSGKAGNENKKMISEIKNLVNDMYAKDFSKKAKIHLEQRRKEGSYVGGPAPYGYIAEWRDKKRVLIPDENTVVIVRFIYEKFLETESYTAVANELNSRKINPPAVYKKTKEVYCALEEQDYKGWDKSAVERILRSETYSGNLVQGKSSITARSEKNRVHKNEKEWVITREAHEPLIDVELHQKVMEICEKIAEKSESHKHLTKGYPLEENIFDRILYCGVCGKKMTRDSMLKQYADGSMERRYAYFCLNAGQTKVTVCPETNRISKNELVDILVSLIRMEFSVFLDKPKTMECGKKQIWEAKKKAEELLRETEGKKRKFQERESEIYMDYRAGNLSQKEYVDYKMKQENTLEDLGKIEERQKKEIRNLEKLSEKYLAVVKALVKVKSGEELTKDMVEALISQIYVYPGKRIEVLFNFTVDGMEGIGKWNA